MALSSCDGQALNSLLAHISTIKEPLGDNGDNILIGGGLMKRQRGKVGVTNGAQTRVTE